MLFGKRWSVVDRREAPERHASKRINKESWQGVSLVRIVELRRREHIGGNHSVDLARREWSCQWVVRGHWRQQACGPEQSERRPLSVSAYRKGTQDQPPKPTPATVV